MRKKTDQLAAEYDQQVKDVGASLLAAAEKIGGPAVFLFCGVRADQGTTTIASAVSRAIASSGTRTVLASADAGLDGAASPSHPLREVVESGGKVSFTESRFVRLILPRQFLELPEAGRDPRKWLKAFDLLIVDAPPLVELAARYWVSRTHGVVLVVDGEKAGVGAVLQARDDIVRLGGTLTGVVLNRFRARVPDFLR
jgi:hypothetical protein